ncbi:MAG: T9SS type A sorting domain-containing protein [Saprospiraceae bacterium]
MRNLIILLLLPLYVLATNKKNSNSLSPQTLVVECPVNFTVVEGQKYDTTVTGFPKVISNDGGVITITYIEIFNNGNCSNGNDLVTRIFTIRNTIGNIERCTQTIYIKHLKPSEIRIPTDTLIEYPKDKPLAQTLLRLPLKLGEVDITFIDTKISNMCTIPIRFKRDWSLKDKCSNEIIKKSTNITLISYQNSFEQNKSIVTDLCGNEGQIVLSPKGEFGPYTYTWNTGATTSSIFNLMAGNYSAVITDAFKCTQLNSTSLTSISETGDIGGLISTEANYRVYPDSIYIDDADNISKLCISPNGGIQYAFKLKIKKLGFIGYRFVKRTQVLDGLSTKDIVIIQKHILNKVLLPDTLRYFAADVNKNNNVTSSDISELRKLLLGIKVTFDNVLPWYFFRTDWKTTISKYNSYESIYFKGLTIGGYPRLNADVLAVKMGDMDLSYNNNIQHLDTRNNDLNDKVYLYYIKESQSNFIDYSIYLKNDKVSIEGLQFAIKVLSSQDKVEIVSSQIDSESYSFVNHILKVSYSTGEPLIINEKKPLLIIRIPRNQSISWINDHIELDDVLKSEFYTEGLIENELRLLPKDIINSQEFSLYPNPANNFILINRAQLDPISELTIFDLTGKILYHNILKESNSINCSEWPNAPYYYLVQKDELILANGTFMVIK